MQCVTIINATELERAGRKHPQTRAWLRNWAKVVADKQWQSIQDVRSDFPSADGVKLGTGTVVTIFNVKGNKYRLLTSIDYAQQWVTIRSLLTHAEYDKQKWM
jgi:mRNA interferase HigB